MMIGSIRYFQSRYSVYQHINNIISTLFVFMIVER